MSVMKKWLYLVNMVMMTNLEIIEFRRDEANIKTKAKGWRVGKYLAIAETAKGSRWARIYSLITGKPVIDVRFRDENDALEVAKWMDQLFGEYFAIWESYPDADVMGLAKWSVESGVQAWLALRNLPEVADLNIVAETYKQAEEAAEEWESM